MRPGKTEVPSDKLDLKKLWALIKKPPPGPILTVTSNGRDGSRKGAKA